MYPVVAHWGWDAGQKVGDEEGVGAGWLVNLGYNDFAGSGIIHLLGGTCACVACYWMGPRRGRFSMDGKPIDIQGHSMPLVALGGCILFFGFLAFNGGSQVRHRCCVDGRR